MLTGDFLMPYLLSSLDRGRGMIGMLNATPIDYVTWGNHEADLAHADVLAREREYEGVWVNTNMPSHESVAASTCQTDVAWYCVVITAGSRRRRGDIMNRYHRRGSTWAPKKSPWSGS